MRTFFSRLQSYKSCSHQRSQARPNNNDGFCKTQVEQASPCIALLHHKTRVKCFFYSWSRDRDRGLLMHVCGAHCRLALHRPPSGSSGRLVITKHSALQAHTCSSKSKHSRSIIQVKPKAVHECTLNKVIKAHANWASTAQFRHKAYGYGHAWAKRNGPIPWVEGKQKASRMRSPVHGLLELPECRGQG